MYKMFNKKAFGLKWYVAILAFLISFGILMYVTNITPIPKIGEFSIGLNKGLEAGNNIPTTIELIMEQLNKESNLTYESHHLFELVSFCNDENNVDGDGDIDEDSAYKHKLLGLNKDDPDDDVTINVPENHNGRFFTKRGNVKCYVLEYNAGEVNELLRYYEEVYNLEFDYFRENPVIWENSGLDFSGIDYNSTMTKEDGSYYNTIKTEDDFVIPIRSRKKFEEKQLGNFKLSPDFKLLTPNPPNHPFDSEEVCIFAVDCGATCHDVIEKYPSSNFKIRQDISDKGCDAYFDCNNPPADQFGESFSCQRNEECYGGAGCDTGQYTENLALPSDPTQGPLMLCQGQCLSFCSQDPPDGNDPWSGDQFATFGTYAVDNAVNAVHDNDHDTVLNKDELDQNPDPSKTFCKEFTCSMYLDCNFVSDVDPDANTCACSFIKHFLFQFLTFHYIDYY